MMTNKEIRTQVKESLRNNWGEPVLATLVYFIIIAGLTGGLTGLESLIFRHGASSTPGFSSLISCLVSCPMAFGFLMMCLYLVRGYKDDCITTMFRKGFQPYGRNLCLMVLVNIFTALWTLLLIVPGIMMGLAYSMAPFIAHDHPEYDPMECIRESKRLMKGNKMKLFKMELGFIGWAVLSIFTLFIGMLWLEPAWLSCRAAFYEDIKSVSAQPAE